MKTHCIRWGLLAALSCLQLMTMAQYQLVLEKPGAFKRMRIQVGDEIGIRVKGMDQVYAGELRGVKATQIFMFGDSLDPQSFDKVRLARPRYWPNMVRTSLIMTAIIYPVMMLINVPHKQWTWQKAVQVVSVSVAALALQRCMKIFYWKRVKLGKGKWQLRIMPTVESLSG